MEIVHRKKVSAALLLALSALAPIQVQPKAPLWIRKPPGSLKRMTDYIGALKQFGAETEQVFEVVLVSGQKLQFSSASRIVVQRPNKLRAERVGDIISQSFYYDGRVLTLSNPNEGYYATVPAPPAIDAMLDFARDKYDVIAPAGDLISDNAYARLMEDTTAGFVVGKSVIGGVRCDQLAFRGLGLDWQVWIEDGDKPFPRKYVITTLDVAGAPQYEVVMNNWTTSPDVSAKQFEFTPPAGATKIEFLPAGTKGAAQ